jgi:hypothetical protein
MDYQMKCVGSETNRAMSFSVFFPRLVDTARFYCSSLSIRFNHERQFRLGGILDTNDSRDQDRLRILRYPTAFATAFDPAYHSRPNGSTSEISDRRRDDLYAGADKISKAG